MGSVYYLTINFEITYCSENRKSSQAAARSGHISVKYLELEGCLATGSPTGRIASRQCTASFHELAEGHAYLRPRGN